MTKNWIKSISPLKSKYFKRKEEMNTNSTVFLIPHIIQNLGTWTTESELFKLRQLSQSYYSILNPSYLKERRTRCRRCTVINIPNSTTTTSTTAAQICSSTAKCFLPCCFILSVITCFIALVMCIMIFCPKIGFYVFVILFIWKGCSVCMKNGEDL